MREILFRAKQKDKGNWVEGYYIRQDETTYCFKEDYERHPENTKHYIVFDMPTDWGLPNRHLMAEIDPETICQYTGLKDKNGKRIWENDIVRIENSMDEGIGNIEFYGGMWYVDGEPSNSLYDIVEYDDGELEVIGNIFDTPELLKENENAYIRRDI